jgi:hypothetical protein
MTPHTLVATCKGWSLIFAVLAAITGFFAAYFWYEASKVDYVPIEQRGNQIGRVPESDTAVWLQAVKLVIKRSAELNKAAAVWTAVSVALAAVSGLVGALAS